MPVFYCGILKVKDDAGVYHLSVTDLGSGAAGKGGIPRIQKGGVTYDIFLVEVSDPTASPARIRTSLGTKAIAYIFIDPFLYIFPSSVYSLCVLAAKKSTVTPASTYSLCVLGGEELTVGLTSVYSLAVA